jgi:hypothetical protein
MAHYAFLDDNNIVTEVIVGIDETELIEELHPEKWYGNLKNQKCVRTSYNAKIRKNFAGSGYFYDEVRDAFLASNTPCHDEAFLDESTCRWVCTNNEHPKDKVEE